MFKVIEVGFSQFAVIDTENNKQALYNHRFYADAMAHKMTLVSRNEPVDEPADVIQKD